MKDQKQSPSDWIDAQIADFLKYKRALGYRFDNEERALQLFNRFLKDRAIIDARGVTPEIIDEFMRSRTRTVPRSFNHLLGVVRRFFDWSVGQGHLDRSPVTMHPRRKTRRRIPFIFNAGEIRRLLDVAAGLKDNSRAPMRGLSYYTIFTVLAGLGLRVGEVSRLLWYDVRLDDALLVIRNTKFRKSRLVPFGPKVGDHLSRYRDAREALLGRVSGATPVFSFTVGRTVNPSTVSQVFHALVPQLQLTLGSGVRPPTVHCLRHSFAVRTLLHWYKSGLDPASRLLYLSTFLGHANVSSTAVYLTITDELLAQANERFERLAAPYVLEAKS